MKRFAITELPLEGLKRIESFKIGDNRGFFSRLFCSEELKTAGWLHPVAQINHTFTSHCGTVRGMHFQRPPHTEMKLVTCLHGEVWDIAIDLRANSSTFLHWHGELLSADNQYALLIPKGFAHGFQTLTNDVNMLYLHSHAYTATAEDALNPRDPMLAIRWPLSITEMSLRDAQHPMLQPHFAGVMT